jgi:hypothetical protein
MRSNRNPVSRGRQRGWIGIVMILVALVIVAVLAKEGLKAYGLGSAPKATTKAGTPGERARAPGAIGAEAMDLDSAPTAPASALERARGVEDMVNKQAAERDAKHDAATQ